MNLDGVAIGDLVRFKYRGEWEYAYIYPDGYSPIDWSAVEPGTKLKQCVWKKDTLCFRKEATMPLLPGRGERLAWVAEQRARLSKKFGGTATPGTRRSAG